MKYLKHINEGITEDELEKLIDYQFIEDAKEMSLEYIDDGFSLAIFIRVISDSSFCNICSISFDHAANSNNKYTMNKYWLNKIKSPGDLTYEIYLTKMGYTHRPSKEEIELRSMAKQMYPELDITVDKELTNLKWKQ